LARRIPLIDHSMVWSIHVHLQQIPCGTGHLIPGKSGSMVRPDATVRRHQGYRAKFTYGSGTEAHAGAPRAIPGRVVRQHPPGE
jgi:hypothetical protein